MVTGLVFDIQRYSIQDGPGIRTTVFLKGCPLRCWWCHNPESQAIEPEIGIREQRCVRCGACWDACPQCDSTSDAVSPHRDLNRCTACGECVTACVHDARRVVGRRVDVGDVMIDVLKDRIFYDASDGGVTLSGGEPLLQIDFARQLLQACRSESIHTAVDTCGHVPTADLLSVASLVDLFLYDIKTLDEAEHRCQTGVSNRLILDNLSVLNQNHPNIWLRVPVVPDVNDQEEQLESIAELALDLSSVRQVNLLPFHEMGLHKREYVGAAEASTRATPPSAERMEVLADRFRQRNIPVQVGG